MATIDGGQIKQIYRFGSGDRLAVAGVWSGGKWSPGSDLLVRQYRDKLLMGIWRIAGVDLLSRKRTDPVLLLTPIKASATIEDQDILVFGDGVYSNLKVVKTNIPIESDVAVEIGSAHYHAIAVVKNDSVSELLVFHEPEASLERQPQQPVWWRGTQYEAIIDAPDFAIESDYPVEIKLNHKYVSVERVIRTLSPVRSFALDVGQELLFRSQRPPGGKRLTATYEYFDPLITVDRGSILLFIHPARPRQIPLFVQTEEPLRILSKVLYAAVRGNVEEVTKPLLERVFSVDELLKKVGQLADTATRFGSFFLRTPDIPDGITVGAEAAQAIRQGIRALTTRSLERIGTLYGMDLVRSWFRIMVDQGSTQEDWTLRFPQEMRDRIEGRAPRQVKVSFETKSRPDMTRGTGTLLGIHDIE